MKTLSLLLLVGTLHAGWIERKAEGWAWYEDRALPSETIDSPAPRSSSDRLSEVRKELEDKLASALLEPSQENINAYVTAQKFWVDKSAVFAREWSRFLISHPELDERARSPVSQYGIQVRKQVNQDQKDQLIRSLASTHGLFFFFEGESKYSQAFARVVQAFANQYRWEVIAVSMDRKAIPEFPNARLDNGIAKEFSVPISPSLYVVNPKENLVVPIAFGLLSIEQLENNVALQFESEGSND